MSAPQGSVLDWLLEYSDRGKTWGETERKGAPSKWVTLRALRALRGLP